VGTRYNICSYSFINVDLDTVVHSLVLLFLFLYEYVLLPTNILTTFLQISGEIPDASPDRHSIRSPTSSYVDPSVPGILSYIIN
jgi:hypothetical protein